MSIPEYVWLQALGELVCAAKARDESWRDQEEAIDIAHNKVFNILYALSNPTNGIDKPKN